MEKEIDQEILFKEFRNIKIASFEDYVKEKYQQRWSVIKTGKTKESFYKELLKKINFMKWNKK